MLRQYIIFLFLGLGVTVLPFAFQASAQAKQNEPCGKQYDSDGQLLPDQDKSKWCKGNRRKRIKRIRRIQNRKLNKENELDDVETSVQDLA